MPCRSTSVFRQNARVPGARAIDDFDLAEIARYIDWTPFFQTWELKGVYPRILRTKAGRGRPPAFRRCAGHAGEDHRWKLVHAARGRLLAGESRRRRYPVYTDDTRDTELATLYTLRQQVAKRAPRLNVAMADFVAPAGHRDYVGGFRGDGGGEERPLSTASRPPMTISRRSGAGAGRPLCRGAGRNDA